MKRAGAAVFRGGVTASGLLGAVLDVDPPKDVRFGEQTTNEMCFVFCGVSSAKAGLPKFTMDGLFGARGK